MHNAPLDHQVMHSICLYLKKEKVYIMRRLIIALSFIAHSAGAVLEFKDVNQTAQVMGDPYLAPALGVMLLETAVLDNIRFFGPHTPGMQAGKPDYTADTSQDPVWTLIKILFPSSNGNFGAYFQHSNNIAYRLTKQPVEDQVQWVATLLAYAAEVRQGKVFSPSEQEDLVKKLMIDRRMNKEIIGQLVKIIPLAVKGLPPYPQGFAEQVVLAFFASISTGPEPVFMLIKKMHALLPALPRDSKDPVLMLMDKIVHETVKGQASIVSPYTSTFLISNGSSHPYHRSGGGVMDESRTFADCGETTLRHLLNIILYIPPAKGVPGSWIIPHDAPADLKMFYEAVQPPAKANDSDIKVRSAWNKVVAGLTAPTPWGPVQYAEGDNNLHADLLNIVRVLHVLFPMKAPPMPALHDQGALKTWLDHYFEALIQKLHPGAKINVAVTKMTEQSGGINGIVTLRVGDQTFTMYAYPGHAYMTVKGEKDLLADSGDIDLLKKLGSPGSLIWLVPTDPAPRFYGLLAGSLKNDTAAQEKLIRGANRSEDITKEYAPYLQVALQNFLWSDAQTVTLLYQHFFDDVGRRQHVFAPTFEQVFFREARGFGCSGDTIMEKMIPLLPSFAQLEHLWVSSCGNGGILDVGRFPHLKTLSMFSCGEKSLIGLEKTDKLENITLMAVKVDSVLDFSTQKNLLDLMLNSIGVPEVRGLERLSKLSRVNISGCRNLSGEILFSAHNTSLSNVVIKSLPKLKMVGGLDSLPRLQSLGVGKVPEVTLKVLDLRGSPLLEMLELTALPHLETLQLGNQSLNQLILTQLPQLSSVTGSPRMRSGRASLMDLPKLNVAKLEAHLSIPPEPQAVA